MQDQGQGQEPVRIIPYQTVQRHDGCCYTPNGLRFFLPMRNDLQLIRGVIQVEGYAAGTQYEIYRLKITKAGCNV